jgi:hypothetical protein
LVANYGVNEHTLIRCTALRELDISPNLGVFVNVLPSFAASLTTLTLTCNKMIGHDMLHTLTTTCHAITCLDILKVDDTGVDIICQNLPNIQHLDLGENFELTNHCCQHFSNLQHLVSVGLPGTIDDAGVLLLLQHANVQGLKHLMLGPNLRSDTRLQVLQSCPSLVLMSCTCYIDEL